MSKISVVVPVFNEEKTVGLVLETLIRSRLFSQIVCVNDGSTDKSQEVIKKFTGKVTAVNLKQNMGKGYSLAEGVVRCDSELVLFLDADFSNLNLSHLKALIEPMKKNDTDAVIGLTSDSFVSRKIFSHLSGQRIFFKKDLIPLISRMKESRYGVEVFLSKAFKKKNVTKVILKDLEHLIKTKKRRSLNAMKEYLVEGKEIAVELAKKPVQNL